MAKENAEFCLLDVAKAAGQEAQTDIDIAVSGGEITMTTTAGDFSAAGAVAGGLATVAGFSVNGDFYGVIKSATPTTLVLIEARDMSGRAKTVVDESAGDSVTVDFSTFAELGGQADTTFTITGGENEVPQKQVGWMQRLNGLNDLSVSASGFVDWPDTDGWNAIRQSIHDRVRLHYRLRLNEANDAYYIRAVAATQGGGGDTASGNAYNFTLNNDGVPAYVAASQLV